MGKVVNGVAVGVAVVLSGCAGSAASEGQHVEIIAGQGIYGVLDDLAVTRNGAVVVMTSQGERAVIWHDGRQINVDSTVRGADEVAAAPDGSSYYVSAADGVWQVTPDGSAQRIVGGEPGFTPDGASASGPAGPISGIGVDPRGRLVYAESLTEGDTLLALVRRVEPTGTVTTLAGRPGPIPDLPAALAAAADPPFGTRATDLPLPGGYYTTLDVDADGTVFVTGKESVLAVGGDTTIRAIAGARSPTSVTSAEQPFAVEGRAVNARVPLYDPLVPPNVSADGGVVALTSSRLGAPPPAAFRWSGDFTAGQKSVVEAIFDAPSSSTTSWPRIRLIRPDGTVTTAAWGAKAAAIRGGWLYLALSAKDRGTLIGRIRVAPKPA
jgi:hypothetical protein